MLLTVDKLVFSPTKGTILHFRCLFRPYGAVFWSQSNYKHASLHINRAQMDILAHINYQCEGIASMYHL